MQQHSFSGAYVCLSDQAGYHLYAIAIIFYTFAVHN